MRPPVLQSDHLTPGPASPDHAEAFIAFCATMGSRLIAGPATQCEAWQWAAIAAGLWDIDGFGPFWVSAHGQPVGRVGVVYPVWRAERASVWTIYPDFEGKGYATEASAAARAWAHGVLGLATLVSLIDLGIAASVRVAQRLGTASEAPLPTNDGYQVMRWRHPGAEQ